MVLQHLSIIIVLNLNDSMFLKEIGGFGVDVPQLVNLVMSALSTTPVFVEVLQLSWAHLE